MLHDFGNDLHHLVDLELLPEEPVVVDAGACIGDFVLAMLDVRPKARIFAIEPSHRNLMKLRSVADSLPMVDVIEAALVGVSGDIMLTDPIGANDRYYQWASVHHDRASQAFSRNDFMSAEMYKVRGVSLWDLTGGSYIDYLKMDIEGSECEVFEAGLNPAQIGQISFEVHTKNGYASKLLRMGFSGIEIRGSEIYARGES